MQNNKKKTIYFSTYDDIKNPHYGGGGAVAIHQLLKRLSKIYNVRVISWDYCGKKKEIIDGVHYERFGLPALSPKIAMFAYQMSLPFIAKQKKFDVWFESFCPPFTTSFLTLFLNKPVVGVVHMLAAEDMERKYHLPFHIIQNLGLKNYKNLIVTSDALKKQVHEINAKSNISIISNGIEKIFAPIAKRQKYILYLGRIEVNQKGLDLLIESFSLFHLKNKAYKLIIAGAGDSKEISEMNALIQNAGLSHSVEVVGKVTGEEKETLLRNAAGVVISSRFETFSLVALEAMACGTPVICFSIKGLSWLSKNSATKVKPFDTKELGKAMEGVVSDKLEIREKVINANKYAKQFTWENIEKQYQEFISHISLIKTQ